MSVLYATMLLSVGVVLIRVLYVVSRLPRQPWWARESVVTGFILAAVAALTLGAGCAVDAAVGWERQAVSLQQAAASAGCLAAAAVVWILMGRLHAAGKRGPLGLVPDAGPGPQAPDQGGRAPAVAPPASGSRRKAA